MRIDVVWGAGDADHVSADAAELVRKSPDVILANGPVPTIEIAKATHAIPIVFAQVPDPVDHGILTSIARPGGNITDFTHFELAFGGKWFEALKEIAPSASAHPPTRRPWTVTGPGPRLFSGGLWRQHSKIGPLDSQPAATILQTECSRQSTTTDEKYHPRPHHRSAA